ncbi:MAG: lysozyme inhibitor LprI family protein [Cyanobacteriota bacterium]
MKKIVLSFLFLFIINMNAFSIELYEKNKIDKNLEICLEKNSITQAQIECIDLAEKEWNLEMDKYYKLLLKKLDKKNTSKLIKSQNNWLFFKNEELKFIEELYKNKQGTMFIPMQENEKLRLIKDRVFTLKNYYDLEIDFSD